MKKILTNFLPQEIRVAVVEANKVIRVLYERTRHRSPVHNIYKGKVLKVLPGMECAFVDIGLPKAAFLYVDDVRTDHFNRETIDSDEELEDLEYEKEETPPPQGKRGKTGQPKILIQDMLKENSEILVQVVKGPIGTKGARVTCNVTVPGRNLVLTPYMNTVAVSRQINAGKERTRLKQIVLKNKPPKLGFIIRTVGQFRPQEEIINDIKYLEGVWQEIEVNFEKTAAPSILYGDLNLSYRMLRDYLSDDIGQFVIDSKEEFEKIKEYINAYMPRYANIPALYDKPRNIFDHYGVNLELDRALGKKVMLPSGGYLIIDQTEALTAIDVNTGSFTGDSNHEDTIKQTNLEAVSELVQQIRIRDLGGIIIIDFIDMEVEENRDRVYNSLKAELKKDKAKTKILQISELGLVEMTRKRSRENLDNFLRMPCPHCNGAGKIKSIETTVYDIYREIFHLIRSRENYSSLLVGVHPDIYDYIEYHENDTIRQIEKENNITFHFKPNISFHHEQYEIFELSS